MLTTAIFVGRSWESYPTMSPNGSNRTLRVIKFRHASCRWWSSIQQVHCCLWRGYSDRYKRMGQLSLGYLCQSTSTHHPTITKLRTTDELLQKWHFSWMHNKLFKCRIRRKRATGENDLLKWGHVCDFNGQEKMYPLGNGRTRRWKV